MFAVFETSHFSVLLESLEFREQEWIRKMKQQLAENPFAGRPLYQEWFREKKFEGKRLYFFVNAQKQRVLLIAFGSKKEQQKTINQVLANKEEYWRLFDQF